MATISTPFAGSGRPSFTDGRARPPSQGIGKKMIRIKLAVKRKWRFGVGFDWLRPVLFVSADFGPYRLDVDFGPKRLLP